MDEQEQQGGLDRAYEENMMHEEEELRDKEVQELEFYEQRLKSQSQSRDMRTTTTMTSTSSTSTTQLSSRNTEIVSRIEEGDVAAVETSLASETSSKSLEILEKITRRAYQ